MQLTKSGKGEVKAADIDTLGQGEIVNKDLHIATMTDPKAKLNIELTAEMGVGYEPEEDNVVIEAPTSSFISDDLLKSSVEELDLPVRITNALKAIEIDTIGKLINVQPAALMKAKNLGTKSLTLISEKLSERGLRLG